MKNQIQQIAAATALTVILFVAARNEAAATTIVVIRGHNEVVLATDSKVTFLGEDASQNAGSVCKIYGVGELFFAVSGFAEDSETNFSVPELVTNAARGQNTVAEKVKAIEDQIEKALIPEVPAVRERDPDFYQQLVNGEEGVISLVLIGMEKGVPFAKGIVFRLTSSPSGLHAAVREDSCPGNCLFGEKTLWLGQTGAIMKYMETRRAPRKPFADFAGSLVQLEIDSKAEGVGGPIDILRVTSKGAEWIQRKQGCPHLLP